ncbi:glycoside hydrolase family 9 protein [Streptosporangium canum]|uniref:glycoside hydrolase family 9 protein n=1 Tax=Streptosporangium canum TaxID=324952 RepID=UPI0033A5F724
MYDGFDAVPHAFGLAATSRLYRAVSGDRAYDAFGTRQRNWTFGANAWGVSFMVGAGENFERCPHHQIANLKGRVDGRRPLATGAVVNRPNSEDLFSGGLGEHFEELTSSPRLKPGDSSPRGLDLPASRAIAVPVKARDGEPSNGLTQPPQASHLASPAIGPAVWLSPPDELNLPNPAAPCHGSSPRLEVEVSTLKGFR